MNGPSRSSVYAILIVSEVAQRTAATAQSIRASEIAEALGLPAAYLAKLMTKLVRGGILTSDRGPRGGFRLARAPNTVEILNIIEAVDGPVAPELDGLNSQLLQSKVAGLNSMFENVFQDLRSRLKADTVSDLLANIETAPGVRAVPPPADATADAVYRTKSL